MVSFLIRILLHSCVCIKLRLVSFRSIRVHRVALQPVHVVVIRQVSGRCSRSVLVQLALVQLSFVYFHPEITMHDPAGGSFSRMHLFAFTVVC